MAESPEPPSLPVGPEVNDPPKRFQFSLKSIMILITLVCAASVPGSGFWDLYQDVLRACVPAALGVAFWKGRGWIRPFAICSLIPLIPSAIEFWSSLHGDLVFRGTVCTLLSGFSGAAVHRFLVKTDGLVPVPNWPFIRNWLTNEDS